MTNRFLTIFLVATALLLPIEATAQSDGGKKKINKAKTERTSPVKKSTNQSKKSKQKPTTGTIAGHEWIDLGLPSGLKWATCNVGAKTSADFGDYFVWRETNTEIIFDPDNSQFQKKSMAELHSLGILGDDGNLTLPFDAAHTNWGGSWRMPTVVECQELLDNCKWEETASWGHNGYKVTGPNGNSIFLPGAGLRVGTSIVNTGDDSSWTAGYMSSSHLPNANCDDMYYLIFFGDSSQPEITHDIRSDCRSIRPVSE